MNAIIKFFVRLAELIFGKIPTPATPTPTPVLVDSPELERAFKPIVLEPPQPNNGISVYDDPAPVPVARFTPTPVIPPAPRLKAGEAVVHRRFSDGRPKKAQYGTHAGNVRVAKVIDAENGTVLLQRGASVFRRQVVTANN